MSQWFAPTSIALTLEGDLNAGDIIVRDPSGRVTELRLPTKHVLMGNHQVSSTHCMKSYISLPSLFRVPTVDIRRLAIPLVLQLFRQCSQRCFYHIEEVPEMDPNCWLGLSLPRCCLSVSYAVLLTLCISQGMQFYRFIFLARSWSADREYLGRSLEHEAQRAQKSDNPFSLMIFPEGTLVSPNTRPLSKKFADKIGIASTSEAAVAGLPC